MTYKLLTNKVNSGYDHDYLYNRQVHETLEDAVKVAEKLKAMNQKYINDFQNDFISDDDFLDTIQVIANDSDCSVVAIVYMTDDYWNTCDHRGFGSWDSWLDFSETSDEYFETGQTAYVKFCIRDLAGIDVEGITEYFKTECNGTDGQIYTNSEDRDGYTMTFSDMTYDQLKKMGKHKSDFYPS